MQLFHHPLSLCWASSIPRTAVLAAGKPLCSPAAAQTHGLHWTAAFPLLPTTFSGPNSLVGVLEALLYILVYLYISKRLPTIRIDILLLKHHRASAWMENEPNLSWKRVVRSSCPGVAPTHTGNDWRSVTKEALHTYPCQKLHKTLKATPQRAQEAACEAEALQAQRGPGRDRAAVRGPNSPNCDNQKPVSATGHHQSLPQT